MYTRQNISELINPLSYGRYIYDSRVINKIQLFIYDYNNDKFLFILSLRIYILYIYPTNAYYILDWMKSEEKGKIEENNKLMQHILSTPWGILSPGYRRPAIY